jgi:hypothetical protein
MAKRPYTERDRAAVALWAKSHRASKRAAYRRWEKAHPEKAQRKERIRVCAKRGITPEDYAKLITAQEGRCALCRSADPGRRSWCIDHDHETQEVRGLLCWKCNLALGWYEKHLKARMDVVNVYITPKLRLTVVK